MAYLSIMLGVVLNLFVFSAVLAKFQSPQKDLVWSTRAVMTRRDGVPVLCVRVGNLRCHTLYNCVIRVTLLRRHVTTEGEARRPYLFHTGPRTTTAPRRRRGERRSLRTSSVSLPGGPAVVSLRPPPRGRFRRSPPATPFDSVRPSHAFRRRPDVSPRARPRPSGVHA